MPKKEVVKAADLAIGAAIAVSYALVHVTCTEGLYARRKKVPSLHVCCDVKCHQPESNQSIFRSERKLCISVPRGPKKVGQKIATA